MSNSLARSGGLVPSRVERGMARALERIDADTAIAVRRDQARLERAAGTAERGMFRAAQIGALEGALVQAYPGSEPYVHASAVAGALGIAGVVYDAGRGS